MPRPTRSVGSLFALVFGSVVMAGAQAQSARPSFDCRKATFADERAICSEDRLARMDQAAAAALRQVAKAMIKDAREAAAAQLKERHACGANRLCILDNQAQLLATLADFGAKSVIPPWIGSYRLSLIEAGAPMVTHLPRDVGRCTRTKIVAIGTRFSDKLKPPSGDEADQGTSIDYADEGHQVSYSYDAAVGASAVGDDVILCLVSLPTDCPPGDDRGKIYSATNLRTKGSWIMPDAQHMCGGA